MKKNSLTPVYFVAIFLLSCLYSCKSGKQEGTKEDTGLFKSKKQAVCIWNGTPLRKEPKRKGKWLSGINLGEKVTYLGESKVDSNYKNREYYKVELSDETQGWAGSFGIVVDASTAAIKTETPLYKRPDMLTASDKTLEPVEFIVITEEKDGWIEVIGNQKRFKGWIKNENITNNDEDVAIAVLVAKEFPKGLDNATIEDLEAFIDELPYKKSGFVNILNKTLAEKKAEEDEKEMMEGESEMMEADTSNE